MAIGLVFLAGLIALPVALGAWALGFVSFGMALLVYVLVGWAVLAAGILSSLMGHMLARTSREAEPDGSPVTMKVKSANRL